MFCGLILQTDSTLLPWLLTLHQTLKKSQAKSGVAFFQLDKLVSNVSKNLRTQDQVPLESDRIERVLEKIDVMRIYSDDELRPEIESKNAFTL